MESFEECSEGQVTKTVIRGVQGRAMLRFFWRTQPPTGVCIRPPARIFPFQRMDKNFLYLYDLEFPDRKDLEMTVRLKKGIV